MPVNEPLVTIGIPTYNRADGYLGETLRSAMAQTYPAVEIVVSDNCSTDDTESFVKDLADERVRYFRQSSAIDPNNNFNFCLNQAQGKYFLLLHDDDCIDPDFVEVCMAAIKGNNDVGIIRTGVRTIDAEGRTLHEIPNFEAGVSATEFVRRWLSKRSMLMLCSTLFNTGHLRSIDGFGSIHNLFQDVAAEIHLATRFGRVDVKAVKASFRKHGGQRTDASKVKAWCEDSLYLLDLICDLFPSEPSFRTLGNRHLSGFNYSLAHNIPKAAARYAAYTSIYKTFDYEYLPFRWFYGRGKRRLRNSLRLARQKVSGTASVTRSTG